MKKQLSVFLFTLILICALCACSSNSDTTTIKKYETANKEAISAAVSAMGNQSLALQDNLSWGMTYEEVKANVEEPYIYDSTMYLSRAFYANLPAGEGWTDKDGTIIPEGFISTDILSYYTINESIGLYEYGYMAPDANLYQYDFLKAYFTNKYGEPEEETWEWNDSSYEPTGDEDYYQMFSEGLVKVLTVWDIEELDTVLVVDWLNDPQEYNNNYGQISFYHRSDDFSVEDVSTEK